MLKEIIIAIQSFFEAHQFIRKHRLWKWILIPGIVYTILFVFGMYLFWNSSDAAVTWLSRKVGLETWLQRERNEWLSFLFVMMGLILRLLLVFLYFSFFKFLFLIIGSPVFAYLSEKTSSIIEGKDFPFSLRQLLKDMWRGIRVALRNSVWQTVYLIAILVVSLIPVFGWVTPVVGLFIECYYYGFSMLDYSMERNRIPAAASIDYIGRHRGLAIGNGLMFYLMHGLIIIGWILAPAYAVVAATLSLYKVQQPVTRFELDKQSQ